MSRLATSFVLGYHGCDGAVARKAVANGDKILHSDKDYDWLGPGAYFWESDPVRAFEWARWKVEIGQYGEPMVIGAVIDLRNCLDLVSREDVELYRAAHKSFIELQKKAKLPIPKNRSPKACAIRIASFDSWIAPCSAICTRSRTTRRERSDCRTFRYGACHVRRRGKGVLRQWYLSPEPRADCGPKLVLHQGDLPPYAFVLRRPEADRGWPIGHDLPTAHLSLAPARVLAYARS